MMGGWSNAQIENGHTEVVSSVKADLNTALNAHHTTFTIRSVKSQVVAGMNYEFELETEDGKKVKAIVFEPLPYLQKGPELKSAHYL